MGDSEGMATWFEEIHQDVSERRQAHIEIQTNMLSLAQQSEDLENELHEIGDELTINQTQINDGVKQLEMLIVRRFEEMQQTEEANKEAKVAETVHSESDFIKSPDDGAMLSGLDPAARRQLRRQRLIEEQRRRIAAEEDQKSKSDEQIRTMQVEHGKLIETNGRFQHKLEACEHTVDETREAIEDMSLQIAHSHAHKEKTIAVLDSEVNYLIEHQGNVQRKTSELASRIVAVETAFATTGHNLQRAEHANELATTDRRSELEALSAEVSIVQTQFGVKRDDAFVLHKDKALLHRQLLAVRNDAVDAQNCVAGYRASVTPLII